jgi:hypothetical protein
MKRLLACAVAVSVGVGCVGGVPREKPVLDPPALPMSEEDPAPSDASAPPAGAWTSVSLKGPGSASYRRIDLILHEDGRCLFVGEADAGATALTGRFTWADGVLTMVRPEGRTIRFECRREGSLLVLTEGKSELRLKRIRP